MLQLNLGDRSGLTGQNNDEGESGKRIMFTYPMIKQSDMCDDMKAEVLELCVNACEKHSINNENAAKMIKESLDKRFGTSW